MCPSSSSARNSSWGPQKISRILARTLNASAPSRSTVARVLNRLGKVKRKRRPVRIWSVDGRPRTEVKGPNDLWTIDFKGWWLAQNGERCEPLTVRDAFSRKVLAVTLLKSTKGIHVRAVLEKLFKDNGLPAAIQSDNGRPFASSGRGGLTLLSAWLVSLGIQLVRSRPACPQDNGGHERMHRDLSILQLTPAKSRRAQQTQCDKWLLDFNHVRPHEALGDKTPAEVYRPSPRRVLSPKVPYYPAEWLTCRVTPCGNIRVNGDLVFLSTALIGHHVGLQRLSELTWRVHYLHADLGTVEVVPMNAAFALEPAIETVAAIRRKRRLLQGDTVSLGFRPKPAYATPLP